MEDLISSLPLYSLFYEDILCIYDASEMFIDVSLIWCLKQAK